MGTVNWIVAGIGDIARKRVLPAILSERRSTLYGLVTRDPAKAKAYPDAKIWATVDEAVTDPSVDAVYIALPVAAHAGAAISALRAGKHVLCEKPMAMNADESRRIAEAAQSGGQVFAVAYYRRTYPILIRIKQLLTEKAIGQPLLVETNCHLWLPKESRAWLLDPALAGGGPLFDVASHRLDAMNFLFGEPKAACGILSNALHDLKVEDSATALVRFADGVHGVVDTRWNSRVFRDQFRVIGSEGEIALPSLDGAELRVAGRVETHPHHSNVHYPLLENFVDAVIANAPTSVVCLGDQALWVDRTIEQILRSSPSRKGA